jgi:hypothetical protein
MDLAGPTGQHGSCRSTQVLWVNAGLVGSVVLVGLAGLQVKKTHTGLMVSKLR